ncbi:hypothetical protein C8R44DRAFT_846036 [Mycena epipterygia]|nr:hypothetical protein C8R44DRAFT_846036 [Mycena epipterygia]
MSKIGRVIGFVKRLTLPSGEKPESPIQNRKHSVGSMEAERGRLALDREVNLVHKALPGTSGDEDEAREIPSVIKRAQTERSSTKGWWVGSKNRVRDEADRGEVDVASTRKDPEQALVASASTKSRGCTSGVVRFLVPGMIRNA